MGRPIALRLAEETEVRDRLGRPLRDLRISLIDRCNYRCPYCMPEDRYPRDAEFLAARERLSPAEIERLVRLFAAEGVSKVRLTGGEPLLRRDIAEITSRIAAIDGIRDLALTTNGALLESCAEELKAAGLGRITVSLDALDPEQFRRMSGGRGCVADVLEGIAAAERAGFDALKINSVIQRGRNEDQVLPLCERFRGTQHVLRFIEYMDVGTCNGWREEDVVTAPELRDRIAARWPLEPVEPGYRGEVAQRYRYSGRRRRNWFCRLGERAVLRRLPSRSPVGGRSALHLSVRGPGTRPARPAQGRRGGRRARAHRASSVGRARRPLQRASLAAPAAARTSRCTGSAGDGALPHAASSATSRTAARAWSTSRPRMRACARRWPSASSSSPRTSHGPCMQAVGAARRARCWTRRSWPVVMAAKRTHELIPFCHPLALERCDIRTAFEGERVLRIECEVALTGKTGVEMEALVGAAVAALTVYDMVKALGHGVVLKRARLLAKSGGKRDYRARKK
jgi:cyclic pyranopterin phosphate synthase